MTPKIVTKDEFVAALSAHHAREEAHLAATTALTNLRQSLPMTAVPTPYPFDTPTGPTTLLSLFGPHPQLILYHFMYPASATAGCLYCSFLADHIPPLAHLSARNTAFAMVSVAPLPQITAFKQRMGWAMPWVSSAGSSFNRDFGATMKDGREQGGVSVFFRQGEDVFHTYSAWGEENTKLQTTITLLDYTPLGRQDGVEGVEEFKYRDEYEKE